MDFFLFVMEAQVLVFIDIKDLVTATYDKPAFIRLSIVKRTVHR